MYTLGLYVVIRFLLEDHAATIQAEFGLIMPAFAMALALALHGFFAATAGRALFKAQLFQD